MILYGQEVVGYFQRGGDCTYIAELVAQFHNFWAHITRSTKERKRGHRLTSLEMGRQPNCWRDLWEAFCMLLLLVLCLLCCNRPDWNRGQERRVSDRGVSNLTRSNESKFVLSTYCLCEWSTDYFYVHRPLPRYSEACQRRLLSRCLLQVRYLGSCRSWVNLTATVGSLDGGAEPLSVLQWWCSVYRFHSAPRGGRRE